MIKREMVRELDRVQQRQEGLKCNQQSTGSRDFLREIDVYFKLGGIKKMVIFKMLREGEVGSCGLARYRDGKVGFGMTSWACVVLRWQGRNRG